MQEFDKSLSREIKQLVRNKDKLVVSILKGTHGVNAKNMAIYCINAIFDSVEKRYKFLEEIDTLNMFNSRDWFFLGIAFSRR